MQLLRDRQSNLSDIYLDISPRYSTTRQSMAVATLISEMHDDPDPFGTWAESSSRVTASDVKTQAGLNLVYVASASGRAAIIDRIMDHERTKADSSCLILRKSHF